MQYANNENGERIEATPNARALCPSCGSQVIAKCGKITVWHWAHISADCDPWYEGMTKWHTDWQSQFPAEYREVVIRKGDETHRADVALPDGTVIEFQHSPISIDDINRREQFYGDKMIWVFDVREPVEKMRLTLRDKGNYHSFRWKHARRSIASTCRRVIFDIGNSRIFDARKIYDGVYFSGWGHILDADFFVGNINLKIDDYPTISELHNDAWREAYVKSLNHSLLHDPYPAATAIALRVSLEKRGAPQNVINKLINQLLLDCGKCLPSSFFVKS